MESLTDEQLMVIIAKNDGSRGMEALDYLYKRYSKPLFNFLYFTLHNDSARAEDFLHDLFLKVLENCKKFDHKQFFKPWVYRMASNMCKNEFRSLLVVKKYNQHVVNTTSDIGADINLLKDVKVAISDLENEQRALIVLRFKMNLSIKEMAEIYECPEGTVKSRLFYATKELSKCFKNIEL